MERRFSGEKAIPENSMWLFMFMLVILFYLGVYGHFRLKAAKSPYAKYSIALFLPLLPVQYGLLYQLKKLKRTIEIKEDGILVESAQSKSDLLPYNSLISIKSVSAVPNGEKIIFKFKIYGLLSINLMHGSSSELIKFILLKAPSADFNKADVSPSMERKMIMFVLLFVFAIIAGTYYTINMAMKFR